MNLIVISDNPKDDAERYRRLDNGFKYVRGYHYGDNLRGVFVNIDDMGRAVRFDHVIMLDYERRRHEEAYSRWYYESIRSLGCTVYGGQPLYRKSTHMRYLTSQ